MRRNFLCALFLVPVTALALDPSLPVVRVEGSVVVDQRLGGLPETYNRYPYRSAGEDVWYADGWRQWVVDDCDDGFRKTNQLWLIDSTQAVETAECGPIPHVPLYQGLGDQLESMWPILDDHPATNDIPAHGMTYRLAGTNITWWVIRAGDYLSTRLSAHDAYGNPIIETYDAKTRTTNTIAVSAVVDSARVLTRLSAASGAISTNELITLKSLFEDWRPGVSVTAGEYYNYSTNLYKVIQSHTTQSDWTPPAVPALFVKVSPPGVIPAWVQPQGAHDAYAIGAIVTHNGQNWRNTSAANVFEPGVFGWEVEP